MNSFLRSIIESPLNQVCFRLDRNIDDIVKRCCDIINIAEKEIYVLTDNCTPAIFKELKGTLRDKANYMDAGPNKKPIKIFVRRDAGDDELGPIFSGVNNVDFRTYQKDVLKDLKPSMQHDYFVIADDHVFWGKPGYNEGCFTYDAPLLVKAVKNEIVNSFSKP